MVLSLFSSARPNNFRANRLLAIRPMGCFPLAVEMLVLCDMDIMDGMRLPLFPPAPALAHSSPLISEASSLLTPRVFFPNKFESFLGPSEGAVSASFGSGGGCERYQIQNPFEYLKMFPCLK